MRDPQLWQKIQQFQIDDPTSEFTFSDRLARDHQWNISYSKRVIVEYKKFMYLCCVGYGEVTPSEAVDQAWHLHLVYTKSYWTGFCQNTLNRQIHHQPTKGGKSENTKFFACYENTLSAYQDEFCSPPPKDIWPSSEKRFKASAIRSIDTAAYLLIKKNKLWQAISMLIIISLLTGLFIQSDASMLWFGFILGVIFLAFIFRLIEKWVGKGRNHRSSGGDSTTMGSSDDSGSFWDNFWGCTSDSSGCSSHGCSSGCSSCSSGCGGGD